MSTPATPPALPTPDAPRAGHSAAAGAGTDLAILQQRLKLALAATQLGTWELDRRSNRRLGSARMAEIVGLTGEQMGRPGFDWFDLVHPDDREAVLAVYFNNRDDNRLVRHQYRMRHAQGHLVWIDACLQVLARDADGVAQHMVGTVRDITAQRQQELQRDRQRQWLDLLNQAQTRFLIGQDLGEACRALLPPLLASSGCEAGLIGVLEDGDDGHTCLGLPAVAGPDGLAANAPTTLGLDNLLGEAVRQDATVLRVAGPGDSALPGAGLPRFGALAALPLRFGTRVVGVLGLGHGAHDAHRAEALQALAADLAPQLGGLGALLHARELDQARRRAEALLQHQASTDALTGLANRGHFMQATEAALALARRQAVPLSVVVIDLDHFKRINDSHGHAAGDEVLRRFAALARPLLRSSDLLGRLGGEEFGVLLRDTPPEAALEVVQRLRQALADTPIHTDGHALRVTMSAGVAGWPAEGCGGVDAWLALADNALYAAKHAGRNTVLCHGVAANDAASAPVAGSAGGSAAGAALAVAAHTTAAHTTAARR